MPTKFGIGEAVECVERERLYWFFGVVEPVRGNPNKGTFKRNGCAEVLRRKVYAPGSPPTERDVIRCKVAKYSSSGFSQEGGKTECGNHRAWNGHLEGPATCRIQVPLDSAPRGSAEV